MTGLAAIAERSPEREAEYLRERAARLRALASSAMPASIQDQLRDVADDLERRAEKLELGAAADR